MSLGKKEINKTKKQQQQQKKKKQKKKKKKKKNGNGYILPSRKYAYLCWPL